MVVSGLDIDPEVTGETILSFLISKTLTLQLEHQASWKVTVNTSCRKAQGKGSHIGRHLPKPP